MTQVYRTHRCTCIGCGDTFYSALDLEQHCDHRSHHQCNKCYTRFPVSYYLQEHSHTCTATSFSSARNVHGQSSATDDGIVRRGGGGGNTGSNTINDDMFMESSGVRPNRGKLNPRHLIAAMRRTGLSGLAPLSGSGSNNRHMPAFQPPTSHNATPALSSSSTNATTIATRDGIALMNHTPIKMTIPSSASAVAMSSLSSSTPGASLAATTDDASPILPPAPSTASSASSMEGVSMRPSSGSGSGRSLAALPLTRSRPQANVTRRPNSIKNGTREQQTRLRFTSNML